ncbi:histone deacetylase [Mesorhizobium sp. CAU 1732]|uniref:histone deacetylase family protein n=1 Tax=Mesorhizobium sp. CAU 1732 TaxID=3140358 RepID=UPI00325FF6AE
MQLPIVHHPDYDARFPSDHRFPMSKYARLFEVLRERGLADNLHVPDLPSAAMIGRAHDDDYVAQVIACTVPKAIEREIGFPVDERVSRRAQLATAGTMLAARLALSHGIACNTAGGSHHARRTQGAGFCTFNDVAVASANLLADGTVSRILVVDLDVHQGDGTAEILQGEARAFTFSMHAEKNYPVRKAQSDLDIGLPDGVEDDDYVTRLNDLLPELERYARPELVFYNAGVDPHADDKLGRLSLTKDGLRRRDEAVVSYFHTRGIPLCGVIGGGYSKDIDALADRHAILFEAAIAFI